MELMINNLIGLVLAVMLAMAVLVLACVCLALHHAVKLLKKAVLTAKERDL
jgi:hypothetical protein